MSSSTIEPQYKSKAESHPAAGRGRLRALAVVCVIVVAAGAAVWKVHANLGEQEQNGKRGGAGTDRPTPVIAVRAEQKVMPIYLNAPGTVTPYYSVTVRTRVDGQLVAVNIREGQQVRKGQLLAQIDPSPFQAAVAQAEGQLAKDQAAAVYASAAAERMRSLFAAGVVSQDREQTSVASAGQAEGALLADKAAIQAAKVNLAFTRMISPIDGVVGLRQVDPGNIVHAADANGLFLITQEKPIAAVFTIPEDQLPIVQTALRSGASLAVEAYDHAGSTRLASGRLLTLDNEIDTSTGTDRVKAVFENKDGALFPNQFVNVRLILREEKNALVIPSSAVQNGASGAFVYVVNHRESSRRADGEHAQGSHAKPTEGRPAGGEASSDVLRVGVRPIYIEAAEGSEVVVGKGLRPGEQVIIDGFERLKEGSSVSLRQVSSRLEGSKGSGSDEPRGGQTGVPTDEGTASHGHHRASPDAEK